MDSAVASDASPIRWAATRKENSNMSGSGAGHFPGTDVSYGSKRYAQAYTDRASV